jgi:hypothetical protein
MDLLAKLPALILVRHYLLLILPNDGKIPQPFSLGE